MTIKIGQRTIGDRAPCFLVAEVGQNHDGSLGQAHAYIDAVADAGFDAVKFQTHLAAAESTCEEEFRVAFSRQDPSRYAYWKRMEFSLRQWQGLADHAREKGLVFLSSAFSMPALEILEKTGVAAWKVGSGEFRCRELMAAMIKTGKPVLLSTGMSRWREIDESVALLKKRRVPFALFQCTSRYPTPPDLAGLNLVAEMKNRYGCPVGLSDHSGKVFAGLAAMALGADMLEVHVTFDRRMFAPDVVASVTVDELRLLKEARNEFHVMLTSPVDKDRLAKRLGRMRKLFTKSIAPATPLKKGTVLRNEMLAAKKPGTGIPYEDKERVLGRKLARDVSPRHLLRQEDLES